MHSTVSLDTHIRVIYDGIDHRLPPQVADMLHPLFLNFSDRLHTGEVIRHHFGKWTGEEVGDDEG
jgi:hypothetical protein